MTPTQPGRPTTPPTCSAARVAWDELQVCPRFNCPRLLGFPTRIFWSFQSSGFRDSMAGPVPLGTQVTELINAARLCKHIFDAFFNQYDNAPDRLRELARLVNTYEEILEQNQTTLRRRATPYPDHEGLKRTLEECTHFLMGYKSVCDRKSHGAKKFVFTGKYALDQNTVQKLDRLLMRHALPMLLWNSNSLLKWAFDRGEEPPVIQQPDLPIPDERKPGPMPPQEFVKDDGLAEARTARLELERFKKDMFDLQAKMPRPLQRQAHRGMFFREFHDVVSRHWVSLGLPANELVDIFTGTDTPDEPLPQDAPEVFTIPTALSLEDIKRCDVTVYLDGFEPIICIGYRVEEDQGSRVRALIWYGDGPDQILMHHVPFQTHPYTYHAKYAQDMHKVQFLQKHNVFVNQFHQTAQPVYAFANEVDCGSFQRFVRNRELLGTFDIHTIRSDTDKLAELQHLKVWRLDGADDQPTLSFFADRLDLYQTGSGSSPAVFCEIPLRCFENAPRHESPRMLRLALNKMRNEVEPKSPKRRLSVLGRRRSSAKASPPSNRSSISVEYAETIYDNVNQPLFSDENMHKEWEYIDIEFTHTTDVLRFIRTCRNAHPRSSFGSHLNIPFSATTSPIATSPVQPASPWHKRSSSGQLESEFSHYRSRSTSSNMQLFPIELASPGPSAAASITSHQSTTASMPPTPALTEQSMETNHTGMSAITSHTPPSLPELHMPPSFYTFQWKHDETYREPQIQ